MRQVTNIIPILQTKKLRHREVSLPDVTQLVSTVPEAILVTTLYCEGTRR